jgi:hypothetical protein
VVYGLSRDVNKLAFLAELHDLRQERTGSWLLTGDLNIIYRAEDKNNGYLDHQLMGQFRRFVTKALLKVIHLHGRLFTWRNERSHPSLEHIDRAFISNSWMDLYPNHDMHYLASSSIRVKQCILHKDDSIMHKKRFHFQSF